MHILDCLEEYTEDIKKKPYIYSMQRMGIDIFKTYICYCELDVNDEQFSKEMLDKLLLYWFPKNKKYLSDVEAYQVVYTIHDIYDFLLKKHNECLTGENSAILDIYGEQYMRIFKLKNLLLKLTSDPVIRLNPIVIDLDKYKMHKKGEQNKEVGTTYIKAYFEVIECKEGGQVILNRVGTQKQYKLLLEYPAYKYITPGDILQGTLKRRLFYVYWELEELTSYYLPKAIDYFNVLNS